MKTKNVLAIAAVLLTGMVSAQNNLVKPVSDNKPVVASVSGASFKWDKSKFEFGKIPQGKPVSVVFDFTNNGSQPLVVTNVSTPCGCTAADYSKESIAPGKKGFVKLTYNASANGTFNKTVTVYANTQPETTPLTISGEVFSSTSAEK